MLKVVHGADILSYLQIKLDLILNVHTMAYQIVDILKLISTYFREYLIYSSWFIFLSHLVANSLGCLWECHMGKVQ